MQRNQEQVAAHERQALEHIVDRLGGEFPGAPRDLIDSAVHRCIASFGPVKIRDFLPIFVERRVRAELSRSPELAGASA